MQKILELAAKSIGAVVQPLVFETGLPEAPYSQAGTVFLAAKNGRVRVVTCRHALRPDSLSPICVFPADGVNHFLPLTNAHFAPIELVGDDYADIALIDVDLRALQSPLQGQARAINLDLPTPDWKNHCEISPFVVIGYPVDRSYIDYEDCHIHSERVALYGEYTGPTVEPFIHSLVIGNSKGLSSFRGFSGGPVFCWVQEVGVRPTLVLAGMVIQGSVESRVMRFIETSVLLDAFQAWP